MISPFAAEIQKQLLETLEPLAPQLAKELKDLILRPIDDSAFLISFEIYPPSFITRFPVRWDWIEPDLGQIEGGNLLVESGGLLKREHYAQEDPLPFALPVLVDWFAKRWLEAGGLDYSLPAYIECRGDERIFNLKNREWVDRSQAYTIDVVKP